MAETDSGSGAVSLFPVSNKLQARMNLLKEAIENQKSDIRRIGGEMRGLIEKKENEIIKELDSIWDEGNARIDRKKEEVQKKIEEIETDNKEMKKNYDKITKLLRELNQTVPPLTLPVIYKAIESAKRELDVSIPYLNLSWGVDELRESINRMCRVEQVFREDAAPFCSTLERSVEKEKTVTDQAEIEVNEPNRKEERERRFEMELSEWKNRHRILEQSMKTADNENEILKKEVNQLKSKLLEARTKQANAQEVEELKLSLVQAKKEIEVLRAETKEKMQQSEQLEQERRKQDLEKLKEAQKEVESYKRAASRYRELNGEEKMAEADSGSGPVSLFPVSNELQGRMNLLKEVIESQKLEVKRIGREMRSLIEKRENEIIKELDSIWDETNGRIDKEKGEFQKKIKEIEKRNKEMGKLFEEMNQALPPLPQISEAVGSAKRELDISIPYLNLSWRVDVLKESINRMCRVEQAFWKETTPFQLTWSKCERGYEETQLEYPCSIAINYVNGNIYVTDFLKHRVEIFSKEGEWIRYLKNEKTINPQNIIIQSDLIYLQCDRIILIFTTSDDKMIQSSKYFHSSLRGICADNSYVYVGFWTEMKLIFFSPKLNEEKQIILKPQSCTTSSMLRDLRLAQEEFYVLLSETEYPIQAFSKAGILMRCIVKGWFNDARYFCLDQQLNLIVSDRGDSKVKIFSNDGKLLNEISRHEGEFTQLAGVAAYQLGCVVTVDKSEYGVLQAFSPL